MHTETSSNGVDHLVDERGRCATCGRDHRDLPTGGRVGPILGDLSLTVEDGHTECDEDAPSERTTTP